MEHTHPLLVPRIEVVGTEKGTPNYPDSPFNSGEILQLIDSPSPYMVREMLGREVVFTINFFVMHPHLFRNMTWYEGRSVEEMPEYVRIIRSGIVCKVSEWIHSKARTGHLYTVLSHGNTGGQYWGHNLEPATLSDYTDYINSKKQ